MKADYKSAKNDCVTPRVSGLVNKVEKRKEKEVKFEKTNTCRKIKGNKISNRNRQNTG